MHRKHAFVLAVLVVAAFVAGLFALTRTSDLQASASTTGVSETAIRHRMSALDRFESSLRRQVGMRKQVAMSGPSRGPGGAFDDDELEDEDGDHHGRGHEGGEQDDDNHDQGDDD